MRKQTVREVAAVVVVLLTAASALFGSSPFWNQSLSLDTGLLRTRDDFLEAIGVKRVISGTRVYEQWLSHRGGVVVVAVPKGEITLRTDSNADGRGYFVVQETRTSVPAFLVSTSPVTVKEFAAFVKETGYVTDAERRGLSQTWKLTGLRRKSLNGTYSESAISVTNVSQNDAMAFCRWAGGSIPNSSELDRAILGEEVTVGVGADGNPLWNASLPTVTSGRPISLRGCCLHGFVKSIPYQAVSAYWHTGVKLEVALSQGRKKQGVREWTWDTIGSKPCFPLDDEIVTETKLPEPMIGRCGVQAFSWDSITQLVQSETIVDDGLIMSLDRDGAEYGPPVTFGRWEPASESFPDVGFRLCIEYRWNSSLEALIEQPPW